MFGKVLSDYVLDYSKQLENSAKSKVGKAVDLCIPQIPYLRRSQERRTENGAKISWWETVRKNPLMSGGSVAISGAYSVTLGILTYETLNSAFSGNYDGAGICLFTLGLVNKVIMEMTLGNVDWHEETIKRKLDFYYS